MQTKVFNDEKLLSLHIPLKILKFLKWLMFLLKECLVAYLTYFPCLGC